MCTHCAFFFSPSPPFFLTLPLSLFSPLCVVFHVPTPLFYQINISQNKSQDNFKLASEERGGKKRRERRGRGGEREGERGRERGGEFGSVCAPPVKWSLCLPCSPHFEVCGFCLLHLGVSSIKLMRSSQLLMNAKWGGTQRQSEGHLHIVCITSRKILLPTRTKCCGVWWTLLPFWEQKAQQQPAITLNSCFSPL